MCLTIACPMVTHAEEPRPLCGLARRTAVDGHTRIGHAFPAHADQHIRSFAVPRRRCRFPSSLEKPRRGRPWGFVLLSGEQHGDLQQESLSCHAFGRIHSADDGLLYRKSQRLARPTLQDNSAIIVSGASFIKIFHDT